MAVWFERTNINIKPKVKWGIWSWSDINRQKIFCTVNNFYRESHKKGLTTGSVSTSVVADFCFEHQQRVLNVSISLTCKVTTYHTQTYATMVCAPITRNSIQRDKNMCVHMHHPHGMWTHKVSVLQCRTVRHLQCVPSLTMLPLATEECTDNVMISLPMFTTVVRRRAGSLIQNINRARAAWGITLEYSASALRPSVFQSVWRGQTFRGQKKGR